MELTSREWWGLIHGMLLGALFLLGFAGGLAELHGLRPAAETPAGLRRSARRLGLGVTSMAVAAWGTVITGTWIVYPWYRDPSPESAKSILVADPNLKDWHEFGMEWKEHVAWIAPMLATSAAIVIAVYRRRLADAPLIRRIAIWTFVLAFATAAVAGILGALITKVAPVK